MCVLCLPRPGHDFASGNPPSLSGTGKAKASQKEADGSSGHKHNGVLVMSSVASSCSSHLSHALLTELVLDDLQMVFEGIHVVDGTIWTNMELAARPVGAWPPRLSDLTAICSNTDHAPRLRSGPVRSINVTSEVGGVIRPLSLRSQAGSPPTVE